VNFGAPRCPTLLYVPLPVFRGCTPFAGLGREYLRIFPDLVCGLAGEADICDKTVDFCGPTRVFYYRAVLTVSDVIMTLPPSSRLRDLLSERPTKKMGQVRAAWPYIQADLQSGHSLKAVWQRLRADGVDIHYNHFSEYVCRLRRRGGSVTPGSESAPPQAEKELLVTPPLGSSVKHDPAANLRERLDRPTGFVYRGTGRKDDLV
jgi:hypothetical protein